MNSEMLRVKITSQVKYAREILIIAWALFSNQPNAKYNFSTGHILWLDIN